MYVYLYAQYYLCINVLVCAYVYIIYQCISIFYEYVKMCLCVYVILFPCICEQVFKRMCIYVGDRGGVLGKMLFYPWWLVFKRSMSLIGGNEWDKVKQVTW